MTLKSKAELAGAVLGGLRLWAVLAAAATYQVPGNYATLQAALSGAPDGATVIVAGGTCGGDLSAVNLKKNLYIKSAGGAILFSQSGGSRAHRGSSCLTRWRARDGPVRGGQIQPQLARIRLPLIDVQGRFVARTQGRKIT